MAHVSEKQTVPPSDRDGCHSGGDGEGAHLFFAAQSLEQIDTPLAVQEADDRRERSKDDRDTVEGKKAREGLGCGCDGRDVPVPDCGGRDCEEIEAVAEAPILEIAVHKVATAVVDEERHGGGHGDEVEHYVDRSAHAIAHIFIERLLLVVVVAAATAGGGVFLIVRPLLVAVVRDARVVAPAWLWQPGSLGQAVATRRWHLDAGHAGLREQFGRPARALAVRPRPARVHRGDWCTGGSASDHWRNQGALKYTQLLICQTSTLVPQ